MGMPVRRPAPRDWRTALPDWESRILERKSLIPPNLVFFDEQAEKALRIFKRLKVPDIEPHENGEYWTHGEACDEWVFDLVRAVFGSYDVAIKRRMIQEFFLLVPKKNGKSSVAAAIMVTAAIMNRRPEAELLLIAPTKKIADIAFKQAHGIIKLDAELKKLFHPQVHQRTLTHRRTGAVIMIKAADKDVITGSKATFILVDETHEFAAKAKAADIFTEIRGSLASRPDGFMIQITTQSKDPPAGVFKDELQTARDVRDGKIILPLLPILFELPYRIQDSEDWQKPEYWPLVNPNFGRSVDPVFLDTQMRKAKRIGAAAVALLASQHFNVEVGLRLRQDRWAGADFWMKRPERVASLDDLLKRSEVVVVGIDGGGLDDLLGLAVLGRERKTGKWLLWCRAWAHKIVLDRRQEVASKLRDFEKEGTLTIVETPGDDVSALADIVMRIEEEGLLAEGPAIAVDAAGIGAIVDELTCEDRGLEKDRIVGIAQGWKLNGAIKDTERKVAGGELIHDGSELMAWCVGNAKAEQRGNAVTINKQASGTAKIDPLMAVFDAVSLMTTNPEAAGSAYEDEDVLV
ncbi:terminase large subunit [Rhodopseudomonas palustris]|uniref:terminase large subunit n=1 Tax=Rhodopseudomonas palustris TaxID=1076 RepID=UPI0022F02887|nr:terminase large subunit [Rhodopseudomonas palustris]WBU27576.1 terminase large subunit [Rhodopseudomonas palustris]